MNEKIRREPQREPGLDFLPEPDLGSLLELQQFILEELGESVDSLNLQKAFSPLTNGLGLDSPPVPQSRPTIRRELDAPFLDIEEEVVTTTRPPNLPTPPPMVNSAATIFGRAESRITPPELPIAGILKRGFGALLDQMFVGTAFAVAMYLTVKFQIGIDTPNKIKDWATFANPLFIRISMLEFSVIWLTFLAVGVGIFDRTFGMWVWGLRVQYGSSSEDSIFMKKVLRIFWSFIFAAPVVTLPLLWIRSNGRNLLDLLSSTTVYETT